jgi:hypothetical protein
MARLKQLWQFDSGQAKTIRHQVHSIQLGDVDDPDLYVGYHMHDWQQTDAGKYVMEHSCPKASWHRHMNMNIYGYEYTIMAYFTPEQLTYWKLKYE